MQPAARTRPGTVGGVPEAESTYDAKRSFDATPEPAADVVAGDVDPLTAPPGPWFVIQQHHATALHHDVRLEMLNGDQPVLVSWAVPKRLPLAKGVRALAIRTEDHPMAYATFSGAIPQGEYGGGEVRIFDRGTWELVDRTDDRLTFVLHGGRMRGRWHLVKTGEERGKEQWLALLSEDLRPEPEPLPALDPMLATLWEAPFDDPAWGFEPKWDGIRALAVCDGRLKLVSRNRNDVTAGYPDLGRLCEHVVAAGAVLDGEIIAMQDGVPSFQLLQRRMHVRGAEVERLARQIPVTFMAFDLLSADGRDLTGLPLSERRELLEEAVVPAGFLQVSPLVVGEGVALYRGAAAQGLEGVVAKRLDSAYVAGKRTPAWRKVKVVHDVDVVVAGWKPGAGRRAGTIGSLVVGLYDDGGELHYVGNVGSGFDERSLREVQTRLEQLAIDGPPLAGAGRSLRDARWVRPELVAKVEYRQVTGAGKLRAPVFVVLRDDKRPAECRLADLTEPEGIGGRGG